MIFSHRNDKKCIRLLQSNYSTSLQFPIPIFDSRATNPSRPYARGVLYPRSFIQGDNWETARQWFLPNCSGEMFEEKTFLLTTQSQRDFRFRVTSDITLKIELTFINIISGGQLSSCIARRASASRFQRRRGLKSE